SYVRISEHCELAPNSRITVVVPPGHSGLCPAHEHLPHTSRNETAGRAVPLSGQHLDCRSVGSLEIWVVGPTRCAEDATSARRPIGARSTCRPTIDEGARLPASTAVGLYMRFGRRPQRGVEALREGQTRDAWRDSGLAAAVTDASFSVEPGEIFVVMGLPGAGKSTLIRVVNGLLPASA